MLQLDPKNGTAYTIRGTAEAALKDLGGAISDETKAIQLDPKNVEAYIERGLDKISLNQKDSGCLDLSKAGELGDAKAYDLIKQFCN